MYVATSTSVCGQRYLRPIEIILLLRFTIHRPLITMNWFLPAIQTELPRLNNGEIFVASQYRQNYRAAEHWQYFDCLIIQTDLPCR